MTWLTNSFRLGPPPLETAIAPPAVWFETVFVYDVTSGDALYQLSPNTPRPLFSLSKLLTALIVSEQKGGALTDTVTVTLDDVLVVPTNAGLLAGDVVSYQDLLKGMLIPSGNDCSNALARNVGNLIYANAGNTGTSGLTRFVEEMNTRAAALGLFSFTMHNPGGYTQNDNTGSARDVAKLIALVEADPNIQPLLVATSGSMTITGVNARTITLTPWQPHSGRANVRAWKAGFVDPADTADDRSSLAIVWQAPNGHKIAFAGLHNNSFLDYVHISMDQMLFQLPQDFPYLDPSNTLVPTDPNIANVELLVGVDTGFADESANAHTLTPSGAVRNAAPRLLGTQSILFDGINDYLETANSVDFLFGSGDWTVDAFFRWDNALVKPSVDATFLSVWTEQGNQRSWRIGFNTINNRLEAQVSTNGSSVTHHAWVTPSNLVFGRGTHHLAVYRSGNTLRVLLNGSINPLLALTGSLHASTAPLVIGAHRNSVGALTSFFPGRMDEIRITKGIARYSGSWPLGNAVQPGRKWART